MKIGITVCFCCCTLAVSSPVWGDVYVDNLAETYEAGFDITTWAHASSFLTDSTEYVLDWVSLDTHSNIASGFSQVKIRSDSGGAPGAVLEDLGVFNITSGGTTLQSLNSTGISLMPNTRYWVTAGETGSGSASWKSTSSTAEVSPGTWTIGDDAFFSGDGGASWQAKNYGPPNESSLFSINATAVDLPYVSNLAETNTVNFDITTWAHASSFLTDNSGYVLDQVTLNTHSNTNSGYSQVKIRSDSGGSPGAVLEDLGTFNITAGGTTLHSLASTGISLSPNTRYWVTAGETGDGSASWKGTTSTAEVSAGTWTIGDDDFASIDGGVSWQPTDFGPANESSLFSVDATEVVLTPEIKAMVGATYTDPVINFGPLSFGLAGLPPEVDTTVLLSEGFPTGGGATGWGLAEVLSTNLVFGDAIGPNNLMAFDMEIDSGGGLEAYSYTYASFDTLSVSGGIIVLNSPLTITGTDIASGLPFSYTYANSTETVTIIPAGDLNLDGFVGIADLNIVLGVWNTNVTPGDLLAGDPSGDGFVGIADLNVVLGNWNAGIPPTGGAAIPEPGMVALLGVGGLMMLRRRCAG
jgi:hypothetical protein